MNADANYMISAAHTISLALHQLQMIINTRFKTMSYKRQGPYLQMWSCYQTCWTLCHSRLLRKQSQRVSKELYVVPMRH